MEMIVHTLYHGSRSLELKVIEPRKETSRPGQGEPRIWVATDPALAAVFSLPWASNKRTGALWRRDKAWHFAYDATQIVVAVPARPYILGRLGALPDVGEGWFQRPADREGGWPHFYSLIPRPVLDSLFLSSIEEYLGTEGIVLHPHAGLLT